MIQMCESDISEGQDLAAQTANLVLRETLANKLREHFNQLGMSQNESSAILKISQPRTSALLNGKIEVFSLDSLVKMLYLAGYKLEVNILKA